MEPITWRALEALKTRLEGIRASAGYYQNVVGVSLEAFNLDKPDEQTPLLHLTTGDMLPEGTNLVLKSEAVITIDVNIESYATPSRKANRDAHRLSHDIVKVLPRRGTELDPDLDKPLEITSRQILQRPEGIPYVVTQVQLRMAAIERFT